MAVKENFPGEEENYNRRAFKGLFHITSFWLTSVGKATFSKWGEQRNYNIRLPN